MVKPLPRDFYGNIYAGGTENITFFAPIGAGTDTTIGWDEVILPDGVECKGAVIQVLSGDVNTDIAEGSIPFAYSTTPGGAAYQIVDSVFSPGVAKASGSLGYIYTGVAGRKIAITVLL